MSLHKTFALASAACLASVSPAFAQSAAPPQTIMLSSFAYAPTPIQLMAGRPVTLTFANGSGKGHDFTARSFFATSRLLTGAVPGGRINLRPGETRTITIIPRAGVYSVHCGHFLHKQMGMRSQIVVR